MNRWPALLVLTLLTFGILEVPTANAEKPRVLLLGDSISIGYTPYVQKNMQDAIVIRPMAQNGKRAENCAGTTNGVKHVDRWLKLGNGEWDVIHFNFGLHDLKREDPETGKASKDPADPRQAELETYEQQLQKIVQTLKTTDAVLIFGTTTPVPPRVTGPHRDPEDVVRYNAAALKIMREHGVLVNDLHSATLPKLKTLQRKDNVHFLPAGSEFLADRVVEAVQQALENGEPQGSLPN